jgi:hypothetical protein
VQSFASVTFPFEASLGVVVIVDVVEVVIAEGCREAS